MSDKWFLVLGAKESGPYDLEHLRDLHLQGMLHPDSRLKTESGEACAAADVAGLFGASAVESAKSPESAGSGEPDATKVANASTSAAGDKEFAVYSSDVKEPGMFAEYMTVKNIVAAVFIGAWIAYGIAVSSYFGEKQEQAQKELDKIKREHQAYEMSQQVNEQLRLNINPEQFTESAR